MAKDIFAIENSVIRIIENFFKHALNVFNQKKKKKKKKE